LSFGTDLGGAVAACGLDEFVDTPSCLALDPMADRQSSEHDRQVRLDRSRWWW
jgi:hypothetical protein